jgi:hypothetical protein
MRKWKRLLLCLCAVLAAAVVFILLASRGRNENAVSLSFVGFTNVPIGTTSGKDSTFSWPMALIRATNYGSVPIKLDAAIRSENFWQDTNQVTHFTNGFTPPSGAGLPKILKPGESSIFEVDANFSSEPWWTEINYFRRGAWERAYGWAWNRASSAVRRKVFRFIPAPKDFWVKAGPFTNRPTPASITIYEVHDVPASPVDYRFASPQFPPNNVDLIQTKP